jgi:hypothetical protein
MEPELRNVHICRDFSKIREYAFDRFVNFTYNKRVRVENGVVVDYSSWGENPEETSVQKGMPKGWNYTVDDL